MVFDIVVDDMLVDIVVGCFDVGICVGNWVEKDMVVICLIFDLKMVVVVFLDYLVCWGIFRFFVDLYVYMCINWWL